MSNYLCKHVLGTVLGHLNISLSSSQYCYDCLKMMKHRNPGLKRTLKESAQVYNVIKGELRFEPGL